MDLEQARLGDTHCQVSRLIRLHPITVLQKQRNFTAADTLPCNSLAPSWVLQLHQMPWGGATHCVVDTFSTGQPYRL